MFQENTPESPMCRLYGRSRMRITWYDNVIMAWKRRDNDLFYGKSGRQRQGNKLATVFGRRLVSGFGFYGTTLYFFLGFYGGQMQIMDLYYLFFLLYIRSALDSGACRVYTSFDSFPSFSVV